MGGGSKGIPDRWLDYKSLGRPIPRTRIVCFKVPLKKEISRAVPETHRFTPEMLVQALPNLAGIIDVTNTPRYYDKQEFLKRGIQHEKILCPGHVVPPLNVVNKFQNAVDNLWNIAESLGQLVGVHCTHGVNRTGYLVCRYLIECHGFQPEEAIRSFGESRGHFIERENYLSDLKTLIPKKASPRTSLPEGQSQSGHQTNATNTQAGGWRQRNAPDDRYRQNQHGEQSSYNRNPSNYRNAPSNYSTHNYGETDYGLEYQDSQTYLPHQVRKSYGGPVKQLHPPYGEVATWCPAQSHQNPSQPRARSSQYYQNPSQSNAHPSQSYQNPSQSRVHQSQSYQIPPQFQGNPSQHRQNPSQSRVHQSRSYQIPPQFQGNPSQHRQNSYQSHPSTSSSFSHPEPPYSERSRDDYYPDSNPSKRSSRFRH